ncbi:tetratricopeptide repeat protein [Shewanella intestini]|uniref:Tetratricopeptide repeat protein n=1 Tax=Shewanella intestini TaxID=2017544 RepID=A0ABS5HYC7_9GAMM|nr:MULTISPECIES: tetratricopeptide repeat protein [Shewanella]MBR9726776.1 tetratricopeptide repeat protein [Shewanella intestini]MRG34658.1 tetratricopeptide repeat protein [Shewanella sp. XMDDZSB0408]
MRVFLCCFILLSIAFSATSVAVDLQQREITFREHPQALYDTLLNNTRYPLVINNIDDFKQAAKQINTSEEALKQDLISLARLTLEANVTHPEKYQQAQTLITQLQSIAVTNVDNAMIIMLNARYNARKNQQYKQAIIDFNTALKRISAETLTQAVLLKFILHEQLSSLNQMVYRPIPALSNLNRYREIAYQIRNDYFISLSESALGKYYGKNNDRAKSLQHYSEAFRIANRLKYSGLKAHAQLNLARTYRDLEQWKDALHHGHNALENFQKLGYLPYVAQALTAIAITYKGQNQWNKAIDYYLNAEQVNQQLGNEIALGINFHNLGEAYSQIGDVQAAIISLQKANDVFRAKQLNHYLVYNELLFAKVTLNERMWSVAVQHAEKALQLANEQSLHQQKIEALEYLAQAFKHLGDLENALSVYEQMKNFEEQNQSFDNNNDTSANLTVQKMKFELGLIKNQLDVETSLNNKNQIRLVVLSITTVLFFLAFIMVLKQQRKQQRRLHKVETRHLLDPTTGINGYFGLLEELKDESKQLTQRTLALVSINDSSNDDINLGATESNKRGAFIIDKLNHLLPMSSFVIRPGVIACYFDTCHHPDQILAATEQALASVTEHVAIPRFHEPLTQSNISIGHINLPLLNNPDILISPQLQFETVQFALAAANSIALPNSYVSLKTLNFAPAAIFSAPLYLNLKQALSRGIIRAESNQNLEKICWPMAKVSN